MRNYLKYFLFGFMIVFLLANLINFLFNKGRRQILGQAVLPTIEPKLSPTPTLFLRLLATQAVPVPTPVLTPLDPLPTAKPATAQEINAFIEAYAQEYAVEVDVLRHVAICESGFKADAVNGDYLGLYQFASITWQKIRSEMKLDTNLTLRLDARESVKTAAYIISEGKKDIWPNCFP